MTMKYRLDRRAALGLLGGSAASVLIPVPGARVNAQTLDKVSYQTNWRAQTEHGGFYLAAANGIYKKYGLDVDIRPGGPQQNPTQLLLGGRVDMIMGNSLEALHFAKEGIPFLCIASIFQKDPQVLIGHPDTGFAGFEDLKGRTLLIGSGGRVTYWPFLRRKYGLSDSQLRPYTFNLAPFLADRNAVQQGFLSSEPFSIERETGRAPVVLLIADTGFSAYQTTIATSRRLATEKKDLLQRFVDATLEGWSQYLKGGPAIAAANALIKQANPEQTDERIDYAIRVLNQRGIVMSGDALAGGIGAMADARWQAFYESMVAVGVLPPGLDVARTHTLEFVNKGIGKP